MRIAGWQKTTLIDYPGHLATVLFTPGCNFRCPFCYNRDLVLDQGTAEVSAEEFWAHLRKRQGLLEGVVLCGGEPTLQPDLVDFVKRVRSLGYLVKLDTNGSLPQVLADLLAHKLLDYVAMDFKAPFDESYGRAIGLEQKGEEAAAAVKDSLTLLKSSQVGFEVRTTLLPKHHPLTALQKMASEIGQETAWVWQKFLAGNCLNPSYNSEKAYTNEELLQLKDRVGHKLLEIR